jgi:hypothetical protein
VIAPDGAHLARPAVLDAQDALGRGLVDFLARLGVEHHGLHAEERRRGRAGLELGVAPGSGVIRWPPVSVCHQVSTMGQRPWPTTSLYQFQASGLIGSPTEPSKLQATRGRIS